MNTWKAKTLRIGFTQGRISTSRELEHSPISLERLAIVSDLIYKAPITRVFQEGMIFDNIVEESHLFVVIK